MWKWFNSLKWWKRKGEEAEAHLAIHLPYTRKTVTEIEFPEEWVLVDIEPELGEWQYPGPYKFPNVAVAFAYSKQGLYFRVKQADDSFGVYYYHLSTPFNVETASGLFIEDAYENCNRTREGYPIS